MGLSLSIVLFPRDIIVNILSFLEQDIMEDVVRISRVNRFFHEIANSDIIWKKIALVAGVTIFEVGTVQNVKHLTLQYVRSKFTLFQAYQMGVENHNKHIFYLALAAGLKKEKSFSAKLSFDRVFENPEMQKNLHNGTRSLVFPTFNDAVQVASQLNEPEILEMVSSNELQPDDKSFDQALHLADKNKQLWLLNSVKKKGAIPSSSSFNTALMRAGQRSCLDYLTLTVDAGALPGEDSFNEAVKWAGITGNLDLIKIASRSQAKPILTRDNGVDNSFDEAFKWSVLKGNLQLLVTAHESGAVPKADSFDENILWAAEFNEDDLEVKHFILALNYAVKAGALPTPYSFDKALKSAVANHKLDILIAAAAAGAKPTKNSFNKAWKKAAENYKLEILETATKAGATPHPGSFDAFIQAVVYTPKIQALRLIEITKKGIELGAAFSIHSFDTTLCLAVETDRIEVLDLMSAVGVQPNAQSFIEALGYANQLKKPQILRIAVQKGALPNKESVNHILKLATQSGHPELLQTVKEIIKSLFPAVESSRKKS